MEYIIATLVLIVLIVLYVVGYLLNSKVSKPDSCKELDCGGCKFNCKRRDSNE